MASTLAKLLLLPTIVSSQGSVTTVGYGTADCSGEPTVDSEMSTTITYDEWIAESEAGGSTCTAGCCANAGDSGGSMSMSGCTRNGYATTDCTGETSQTVDSDRGCEAVGSGSVMFGCEADSSVSVQAGGSGDMTAQEMTAAHADMTAEEVTAAHAEGGSGDVSMSNDDADEADSSVSVQAGGSGDMTAQEMTAAHADMTAEEVTAAHAEGGSGDVSMSNNDADETSMSTAVPNELDVSGTVQLPMAWLAHGLMLATLISRMQS